MGADMYIKNLPKELQMTGFRTDVNVGYYRDAYNNSNLLWQFNLSYWGDMEQWVKDGEMTVQNAIEFLAELKRREPIFEKNLNDLLEKKNRVWDYHTDYDTKVTTHKPYDMSDKDRLKWYQQYKADYEILKKFLKKAIELKSGIDCSF